MSQLRSLTPPVRRSRSLTNNKTILGEESNYTYSHKLLHSSDFPCHGCTQLVSKTSYGSVMYNVLGSSGSKQAVLGG